MDRGLCGWRRGVRARPASLVPVPILDGERSALASRQLEFYGNQLCANGSCGTSPNQGTVTAARTFLQQFADADQDYTLMISRVGDSLPAIRLSDQVPEARSVILNDYIVPGAFTVDGWRAVEARLRGTEVELVGEDWVLGTERPSVGDRAQLVTNLRQTYINEYVMHWKQFLLAASLRPYGGFRDAANKLESLAGNESPLLQMLALTATHTFVDTVENDVGKAFQPVQVVTPAGARTYVNETNAGYMNALVGLQSALDEAASERGASASPAVAQALTHVNNAEAEVTRLAQAFEVQDDASEVGAAVQRLMRQAATNIQSRLRAYDQTLVNEGGRSFCGQFSSVLSLYPFSAGARSDATLDDVASLFAPQDGGLWGWYDATVRDLVVKQGSRFIPQPGASMQVTPQALDFLNRGSRISEALYPPGQTEPNISFRIKPELNDQFDNVRITINGRSTAFTRTSTVRPVATWAGGANEQVLVSTQISGRDVELLRYSGTWAIFRFLQSADWASAGSGYLLTWDLRDQGIQLVAELDMAGAEPIWQPGYLQGLSCPTRVAR